MKIISNPSTPNRSPRHSPRRSPRRSKSPEDTLAFDMKEISDNIKELEAKLEIEKKRKKELEILAAHLHAKKEKRRVLPLDPDERIDFKNKINRDLDSKINNLFRHDKANIQSKMSRNKKANEQRLPPIFSPSGMKRFGKRSKKFFSKKRKRVSFGNCPCII
jgi:hypothetical protein